MTDNQFDIQATTNAPPCEMRDLLRLSIEAVARNGHNHGKIHAPRKMPHFMGTHPDDSIVGNVGVGA